MAGFSISLFGYKKKQVEQSIRNTKNSYDTQLQQLRSKLAELEGELAIANAKVDRYVGEEQKIAAALLLANQKKSEVELLAVQQLRLQNERIRKFTLKWEQYAREAVQNPDVATAGATLQGYLTGAMVEIKSVLQQSYGITFEENVTDIEQAFLDETTRLAARNYPFDWNK